MHYISGRFDKNPGFHCNGRRLLTYNGKTVLTILAPSVLIGSCSVILASNEFSYKNSYEFDFGLDRMFHSRVFAWPSGVQLVIMFFFSEIQWCSLKSHGTPGNTQDVVSVESSSLMQYPTFLDD